MVTPQPESDHTQTRRLTRNTSNKVLGGVASGMADYFGVDTALVRLVWVLLAFAGIGVPAYIVAWIVIPEGTVSAEHAPPRPRAGNEGARLLFGALLVAVGGYLLVERFVPWLEDIALPALLIALGAGVVIYGWRR